MQKLEGASAPSPYLRGPSVGKQTQFLLSIIPLAGSLEGMEDSGRQVPPARPAKARISTLQLSASHTQNTIRLRLQIHVRKMSQLGLIGES